MWFERTPATRSPVAPDHVPYIVLKTARAQLKGNTYREVLCCHGKKYEQLSCEERSDVRSCYWLPLE